MVRSLKPVLVVMIHAAQYESNIIDNRSNIIEKTVNSIRKTMVIAWLFEAIVYIVKQSDAPKTKSRTGIFSHQNHVDRTTAFTDFPLAADQRPAS